MSTKLTTKLMGLHKYLAPSAGDIQSGRCQPYPFEQFQREWAELSPHAKNQLTTGINSLAFTY